jgi:predicted Zn-dependent peptidase
VVLALCLVAPAAGAQVARAVSEFRLANGLRVVVSPDPASADVSVLVRYDVGARDDPSGLTGLAHLSEHLMCDSTKHVPLGQLQRLLQGAGATNINGETAIDWTMYHETLPLDRLDLALWLESDRMGYQLEHIDEAALARDRAAVLNEYRDRVTDVLVHHPSLAHARAGVLVWLPALSDDDMAAVEVLAQALGGISSWLYHEVREEQGAAYAFGASVSRLRAAASVIIGGQLEQ